MDATQIATVTGFVRAMSKYEISSVEEANVYVTVLQASMVDAKPITLAQVVKATKIPFSTASRMAWSLSQRGLIKYQAHPTDRRKKLLIAKNLNGG
jgi:DNA-binding MarR family transcriptional regulator